MLNTLQAVLTAQNKSTAIPLGNGQFKFTLALAANTSAGVYDQDDYLIRTLWSGKKYNSGTHIEQWDGLRDDNTTQAPFGTYTIKVLTNNVNYVWEGVIGNTSDSLYNYKFGQFGAGFGNIAFSSTRAFWGEVFAEGNITINYFDLADIGKNYNVPLSISATMQDTAYDLDTDNVYYSAYDDYTGSSYIMAIKATDLSPVGFANEQIYVSGRNRDQYNHFFALHVRAQSQIRQCDAIAIQKGSDYLFTSSTNTNEVFTYNKKTAALLNTQTINNAKKLACGSNNDLWTVQNNPNYTSLLNQYFTSNKLTGTLFSNGYYNNESRYSEDKAIDGDTSTRFQGIGGTQYLGMDLGTAKSIKAIQVTTAGDGNQYTTNLTIQGSNTSTTDGFVDIGSWGDVSNGLNTFYTTDLTAYRYVRLVKSDNFLLIAELAIIQNVGELPQEVVCKKYNIAANGSLSDSGIQLAAYQPDAVDVSPDGNVVVVCDMKTSQVIAYSTTTGDQLWTLGQSGGYVSNGPAITNNKFMFTGGYGHNIIKFKPDGSFVVQCQGTSRLLFYNADRNYSDFISWIGASRSSNVDPNNITSIFADEIEFVRDYSKPLDNSKNHSWKFAYNWKIGTDLDIYGKFERVISLQGRTYGFGKGHVYLLDRTSGAKLIGSFYGVVEADGSIWTRDWDGSATIYRSELTGFSPNFMIEWGNRVKMVSTPQINSYNPLWYINNTKGMSTNDRRYIFFNPQHHNDLGNGTVGGLGYHLGSVKIGETDFEWQTSNSTRPNTDGQYHGQYPLDGWFDIGNNEYGYQHSENCQVLVQNSDIFWNVNCEFYKANSEGKQANVWNHFHESGLHIGNFGVTGFVAWVTGTSYGFAGNAFSTAIAKYGPNYYIYHCDESKHSGVHSWKVSGLDTIDLQTQTIIHSVPITPIPDPTNMMIGLPWRGDGLYTNIAPGWTVYPTSGSVTEADFVGWYVGTSVLAYSPDDIDLFIYENGDQTPYNHYVTRDFPVTTSNNWKFKTEVSYMAANGTNFLELIDVSGKVIIQIQVNYQTITVNGLTILNSIGTPTNSLVGVWNFWNDLTVDCIDGVLHIIYAHSQTFLFTKPKEDGANPYAPAKFRATIWGVNDNGRSPLAVKKMWFIPGTNNPNTQVTPVENADLIGYLDFTSVGTKRLKSNGIIEQGVIEIYPNDGTPVSLWSQTDAGIVFQDAAHTVGYMALDNNPNSTYRLTITGFNLPSSLYVAGVGGVNATSYSPTETVFTFSGNHTVFYSGGAQTWATVKLEKLI